MLSTSEKIKLILDRSGHNITWLAEQWGITQSGMSRKISDDNWKESDLKKFCSIMGYTYNVVFEKNGNKIE